MDDRALYRTILGLTAPWEVSRVEVDTKAEAVRVHVEAGAGSSLTCPECGEAAARYDRSEEREWRHLDTCQYRTVLVAQVPRVRCAQHGIRQVRVPWAEERSRFTALFETWAIRLLGETTVAGVAALLRISWDEAEGILRRAVARGLARRSAEPLRAVGIDETSFQKRHEYVTVVADLERGHVLWVGDHRRESTLREYWESRPRAELRKLKAIVMDMWDPYIKATRDHVPDGLSKIVFDRYHVMAHLNGAVDEVRRAEQRELQHAGEDARAQELKGTRFAWLKGWARRSLGDEELIARLRRSGFKVGRAWGIKEAATDIWLRPRPQEALETFRRWYSWAIRSRLKPIKRAARMMKTYLYGILRYTKHRYTNAMTEGINSQIQRIKHQARGYRNRNNFRLAILFHCGGLNMNPR